MGRGVNEITRRALLYYFMTEKTDEEIAILVQEGDIQSFGSLIERYERKILRFGKRFLSDEEDIQDIVQEIFIKVYANMQNFDASQRFSPWIYRIAHNEFVNAVKKKNREKIYFFDFDVDTIFPQTAVQETTDEEINKQDIRQTLDNCLGKLDVKYREPLILYYFEDMSYKDIASILQIPISTVGVRLQRGKIMLKKIIKQLGEIL